MNQSITHQTLDIKGTINTYKAVRWNVAFTIAFAGLGICLWLQIGTSWIEPWIAAGEREASCKAYATTAFIFAALSALDSYEHTYLDFVDRQIVTFTYRVFGTSKRCRPLSDFSNVVVRHLCHSDSEGPDTYTGGVGLKPVNGGPVFWVKSFPTTEDEIPQAAYAFARELQELMGQPGVLSEKQTTNTEVRRRAVRTSRS